MCFHSSDSNGVSSGRWDVPVTSGAAVVLWTLVMQRPVCVDAPTWLAGPTLASVDMAKASDMLERAEWRDCDEVTEARLYVEGLNAAARAWQEGGTQAALAPVRDRIARLEARARAGSRVASVAGMVLAAGVAAAQNEAAELALLLEQALALEDRLRAITSMGLPVVGAAEAAGDCWLRLYRYPEAVDAYLLATHVSDNARLAAKLRQARDGMVARTRR